MYSAIGLKLDYNMKAYLETIVVARNAGSEVSPTVSQIVLDFDRHESYVNFRDTMDSYEMAPNFEIFRTLMPLW